MNRAGHNLIVALVIAPGLLAMLWALTLLMSLPWPDLDNLTDCTQTVSVTECGRGETGGNLGQLSNP